MTARSKLSEAKHFLELIDEEQKKDDLTNTKRYIGAFLGSLRSITDHSLTEVSKICKLDFSDEEKITQDNFKNKSLGNEKALEFLKWYKKEIQKFQDHEFSTVMKNLRDTDTHEETIQFESSIHVLPKPKMNY